MLQQAIYLVSSVLLAKKSPVVAGLFVIGLTLFVMSLSLVTLKPPDWP
ncbi:MAG TPA: hypothetical protein VKR06_30390 [Ktedonosporobacter sp.]|nr:hypothetical protein [Ktedonosporobacter sp.]